MPLFCPYCGSQLKADAFPLKCEVCSQVVRQSGAGDSARFHYRPAGGQPSSPDHAVPASGQGAVNLTAEVASAPHGGPAWEGPRGFWARLLLTTKQMLINAKPAMAAPAAGGLGKPLSYLVIMSFITTLVVILEFAVLFVLLIPGETPITSQAVLDALANGSVLFVVLLVAGPVFCIPVVACLALFFHIGLIVVQGARKKYSTSLRAVCYAWGAVYVWNMVPLIGYYILLIWGIVSVSLGLAGAHGIGGGRGLAGLAVGLVIMLVALILLAVLWGLLFIS